MALIQELDFNTLYLYNVSAFHTFDSLYSMLKMFGPIKRLSHKYKRDKINKFFSEFEEKDMAKRALEAFQNSNVGFLAKYANKKRIKIKNKNTQFNSEYTVLGSSKYWTSRPGKGKTSQKNDWNILIDKEQTTKHEQNLVIQSLDQSHSCKKNCSQTENLESELFQLQPVFCMLERGSKITVRLQLQSEDGSWLGYIMCREYNQQYIELCNKFDEVCAKAVLSPIQRSNSKNCMVAIKIIHGGKPKWYRALKLPNTLYAKVDNGTFAYDWEVCDSIICPKEFSHIPIFGCKLNISKNKNFKNNMEKGEIIFSILKTTSDMCLVKCDSDTTITGTLYLWPHIESNNKIKQDSISQNRGQVNANYGVPPIPSLSHPWCPQHTVKDIPFKTLSAPPRGNHSAFGAPSELIPAPPSRRPWHPGKKPIQPAP